MLKFNVQNQIITRTDDFLVVADSRNYLTAEFAFSEEWTQPVTAVFAYGKECFNALIEDGQCSVPWEVIKAPFFTVSVFCGDRITANSIAVAVEKSGYVEGETSKEPTPDIYSQMIALSRETKEIAKSVRDDANSGVFNGLNGERGADGRDGQDGYTPVKGTDYFTADEVSGIVMEVTENVSVQYGDVGQALDGIIAIQNELIGGGGV